MKTLLFWTIEVLYKNSWQKPTKNTKIKLERMDEVRSYTQCIIKEKWTSLRITNLSQKDSNFRILIAFVPNCIWVVMFRELSGVCVEVHLHWNTYTCRYINKSMKKCKFISKYYNIHVVNMWCFFWWQKNPLFINRTLKMYWNILNPMICIRNGRKIFSGISLL